jgi:SSS family solute:Na+ symporter
MKILDWLVLGIYFLVMLGMGFWARAKLKIASDFFTAGGAMPWWLSGISPMRVSRTGVSWKRWLAC